MKNKIHNQFILNIVKLSENKSEVIYSVMNRQEAAIKLANLIGDYSMKRKYLAAIKAAFQKGGRIYEVEGYRVVKTNRPARSRNVNNALQKRKIDIMCSNSTITVTSWRR